MGYDLNFWRYVDETAELHMQVCHALCKGGSVSGLEEMPVDDIKAEFLSKVPANWVWAQDAWERHGRGTVIIQLLSNWVRFDRYGLWDGNEANWLINVMVGFKYPLFDPQVPERFVQ